MAEEKKMTEEDIIVKLSQLYIGNVDPETLCSATFREFDKEHLPERQELRNKLFRICYLRGDKWTK